MAELLKGCNGPQVRKGALATALFTRKQADQIQEVKSFLICVIREDLWLISFQTAGARPDCPHRERFRLIGTASLSRTKPRQTRRISYQQIRAQKNWRGPSGAFTNIIFLVHFELRRGPARDD